MKKCHQKISFHFKEKSKFAICLTERTFIDEIKKTKYDQWQINKNANGRLIMQSKCAECEIKKSRFMKEQEAKVLLSNVGIKTPLSKVPLLNVLF